MGVPPLSALLGAFVQAQDDDDPPLPVMLIVSGLPPLAQHLQAARSHSERLFRVEELGNLSLAEPTGASSEAALALIKPAEATNIHFEPALAERIAKDVDGYPYFIQKVWRGALGYSRCGERRDHHGRPLRGDPSADPGRA